MTFVLPDADSCSESLEQWTRRRLSARQLQVRRPVAFAPHYAPRPEQYDDVPVVLLVATAATRHLHQGLLDGIRLLQEATYGFRPLVITDDVTAPALHGFEWAVEHIMAEDHWVTLSPDSWLAMAAEHVTWAQDHYGAVAAHAATTPAEAVAIIQHIGRACRAPQQVVRVAADLALDSAAHQSAEVVGLRGWWAHLPKGSSVTTAHVSGESVTISVRRCSGPGLLITTEEDDAACLVAQERGWTTVAVAPTAAGLSSTLASRAVRAARDALSATGPTLLTAGSKGAQLASNGLNLADGVLEVNGAGGLALRMSYGSSYQFPADELGPVLDGLQEVHRRTATW